MNGMLMKEATAAGKSLKFDIRYYTRILDTQIEIRPYSTFTVQFLNPYTNIGFVRNK